MAKQQYRILDEDKASGSNNKHFFVYLAIFLVLIVLIVLLIFAVNSCDRQNTESVPDDLNFEAPLIMNPQTSHAVATLQPYSSTPVSNWKKGEMPLLLQFDTSWSLYPYAGGIVAVNGCGPTALTMVYVYLTGNVDFLPSSMCQFSEDHNYTEDGKTLWKFMDEGAQKLGLKSKAIDLSEASFKRELSAGKPIIVSVKRGDFTTTGHFIVLYGLDTHGQVKLRDPNNYVFSNVMWDLDRILKQTKAAWVYST